MSTKKKCDLLDFKVNQGLKDNVLLTGYVGGPIDFGGGMLNGEDDFTYSHDVFQAKLSP